MAFTTYRQQDAPWGSKNYNGSGTVGANGCGPTSCAIVISYLDPSVTPTETVKYMQKHNYAIRGNGTAWAGITACLKAYGFDAKNLDISKSMKPLWDALAKNKVKCGVLLFRGGTRGGCTWTKKGHYVAFTDYKIKKGKHYLYTRDPNKSRRNDGWHCYETTMRGLLPTCFVANPKSAPKEKKTYTGEFPNLTVTTKTNNAEKLASSAESISWAKGTSKSKWSYDTGSPTSLCKTWMQKLSYKTKIAFSDCGYFMRTCVYKAFGTKVKFLNGSKAALPTSVEGFTLAKKGTSIKTSDLKRGDVIAYKITSSTQHTLMYLGGGLITEAGRGKRFGRIIASTKYTGTKHNVYVWRAKESTKTTVKALVKNDSRTAEVKKLQEYLAWYGYSLEKDGKFGINTEDAVKKFQKAQGLAVDGKFGSKSLAKAKAVKK